MSFGVGLNYNSDRSQQVAGTGGRGYSHSEFGYLASEADRAAYDAQHNEDEPLAGSTTVPSPASSEVFATPAGGPMEPHSSIGDHVTKKEKKSRAGNQDDLQEGREEVHQLARQMSRHSTVNPSDDPFSDNIQNPAIDPSSPNFNSKAWMKSMLQVQSRDADAYPTRTAGVLFRNLNAYGYSNGADYQKTVSNAPFQLYGGARSLMGEKGRKVQILSDFDGLVKAGEMCVVLGPPGSGCSTFLKTITGETHGFNVEGELNYQGISAQMMHKNFRGEAIYTAEQDIHFPQLTVSQTLSFAAEARAPRKPLSGLTQRQYAHYMSEVMMATFGIPHTRNTRVGNDFVRGVSGGERKRVSLAEAALSGAPLQCWDNSTRGLDSANAVEFIKNLRLSTDLMGCTAFVAIYQSPQAAYDYFDKALVLYEGRTIYFGNAKKARQFFQDMGFECPERQTTPDFLTSLTSSIERTPKKGFENQVPRTPDEFAAIWKASAEYKALLAEMDAYDKEFPIGGEALEKFKDSRRAQQAKRQSVKSPYTLSYNQQIKLCLRRGFWRLKADPSLTVTQIFGNSAMAFIVSSIFFNLQPTSSSFFQRGALLFFAVLLNAFGSALEILTLYAQRPIIEKHARYALYHPSAESYASMLTDMPYKIGNAIVFNCILYFMTNLNRHPGNFFFFLFVSFILTLTMSMLFRTIASVSRTLSQALAPAAIIILAIVIFTGFALPINYMLGWSRWINYINPVAYGFESLMINEFWGRDFACNQLIPSGPGYDGNGNQVCSVVGALDANTVRGGDYIALSFQYYHSHKWRNVGIIFAIMIFLLVVYLVASELVSSKKSKGEILVFRRGHEPKVLRDPYASKADVEAAAKGEKIHTSDESGSGEPAKGVIQKQTAIFHWQDVCYDIKIKSETRRILDHVDGWVKPGQLTALMGVSGAGKTTLLDVLATRVTMGVVSGEMLVDGRMRDSSFQRKTGYVQQQDLHLETSTVREALEFSAILRQPAHVPRAEKVAYVHEIIKLLDMEPYADAVVGVLGEGLNVEQRKRLTIGVEMAAKPELLLFLDEPTSGLDSQTSWSILNLLEKLTRNGQAILCTIHQPSAMLFSRFDRLLFLAKGGKTVYFGEVGDNSSVLTKYFEANGAKPCPSEANPAEWMLEVIGAAPGTSTEIDWHKTWLESSERQTVRAHLADLKQNRPKEHPESNEDTDKSSYREFAATTPVQALEVTKRIFQQLWRTPSYIYSKTALCVFSALFIGFSFFDQPLSSQGLQNQMFAFFLLLTIFGQLVQQIMPHFVKQRELYEARERPSKTYSWQIFMLSNIVSELPYAIVMGTLIFVCWYYPIGMYKNAAYTGTTHSRGALMWAFLVQFLLFTSTFTHMVIAAIPTAETAGNIGNLMFSLTLLFCGVLASPSQFPGFWIFMYRVSPFTYMVDGILSTGLANAPVTCSDLELLTLQPAGDATCGAYLDQYAESAGARILNRDATADCQLCPIASTNSFLSQINSSYDLRFRNFGIIWAFICINIAGAFFFYWLGRVPKKARREKETKKE